jgi:hypothetical protein
MLNNVIETINPEAKSTVFVRGTGMVIEVRPSIDSYRTHSKEFDLVIKNEASVIQVVSVDRKFNYNEPITIAAFDKNSNPYRVTIWVKYGVTMKLSLTVATGDDFYHQNQMCRTQKTFSSRTSSSVRNSVAAARAAGVSEDRIMHSSNEMRSWLANGRVSRV